MIRSTLAALAAGFLLVGPAAGAQPKSCRPTLAQFTEIPEGISYAQAKARLGCAGRRVSRLKIGRRERVTYTWYGRGTYGANLSLTFNQGRMSDKSQLGLR